VGVKLENASLAQLGQAKRIVIDKEKPTIVDARRRQDGGGRVQGPHVAQIRR
jgi:hypothetical protein